MDIDALLTQRVLEIAELERKLAAAHNAMEALVESNARLRRELYEMQHEKLTLKEQLK